MVMSPQVALCEAGSQESSADGLCRAGLARREVGWIPLHWARITQAGSRTHGSGPGARRVRRRCGLGPDPPFRLGPAPRDLPRPRRRLRLPDTRAPAASAVGAPPEWAAAEDPDSAAPSARAAIPGPLESPSTFGTSALARPPGVVTRQSRGSPHRTGELAGVARHGGDQFGDCRRTRGSAREKVAGAYF